MSAYWPEHPDDEWIDITAFGAQTQQLIRGKSGAEAEVNLARTRYVEGLITIEELEAILDKVFAA